MSMIPQLGFDDSDLTDTRTRTAAGVVRARRARLPSVRLGNILARASALAAAAAATAPPRK